MGGQPRRGRLRRPGPVRYQPLAQPAPDIRATAQPDRLLSSFINGIKHPSCDFTA